MSTDNKLKAYVRFDGSGRVVPGSLILQKSKPKVGKWIEIPARNCCGGSDNIFKCIEFIVDTTESLFFSFIFTTEGSINFTIDWGDGTNDIGSENGGAVVQQHNYPEIGQQYIAKLCFDNILGVKSLNFSND